MDATSLFIKTGNWKSRDIKTEMSPCRRMNSRGAAGCVPCRKPEKLGNSPESGSNMRSYSEAHFFQSSLLTQER